MMIYPVVVVVSDAVVVPIVMVIITHDDSTNALSVDAIVSNTFHVRSLVAFLHLVTLHQLLPMGLIPHEYVH